MAEKEPIRFMDGGSAKDFADTAASALRGEDGELQVPGSVLIECEDFTLPDSVVMGGTAEVSGQTISYFQLFSGALKHFHGLNVTTMLPVETGQAFTSFGMGLLVTFGPELSDPVGPA